MKSKHKITDDDYLHLDEAPPEREKREGYRGAKNDIIEGLFKHDYSTAKIAELVGLTEKEIGVRLREMGLID